MDGSTSQPPPPPPPKPPSSPPLPPPLEPQMPTESRVKRFKLIWRAFMIANLGLGAYIFAMAKMRDASTKSDKPPVKDPPVKDPPVEDTPLPSESAQTVDVYEEPDYIPTPIADLVKVHEPIHEDQQRQLFEWILDEKRKVKPRDKKEKKQIDEEKAILKRFIRAESVPPL